MSQYLNIDCMDVERGLPSYPDKFFDLAIVDPPYGIDISGGKTPKNGFKSQAGWDKMRIWDSRPNVEYFAQLFRVSKHQIIWGANYYPHHLPPSQCWIVWDKGQRDFSFAHGELAFCSVDSRLQIVTIGRGNESGFAPKLKTWERQFANIHATQKPMALYRWILANYAKPGMKLLDTHVGSASSLVVFEEMGFEYHGFEIDADYYKAGNERLDAYRKQGSLFTPKQIFEATQTRLEL